MGRLNIRIADDLKAQAQAEAARGGDTLAEFVRQSIVHYLAWIDGHRGAPAPPPPEKPDRPA